MDKHAYLIMVHNDIYIFDKLVKLLDDKRNDLYVHVDRKMIDFPFDKYKNIIKNANITFVDRMDVRWGTIKQIECTLLLLNEALKTSHKYYHFISGVDLPLKSQDYIHDFFNKSEKDFIEFVDFNKISQMDLSRIKIYHFFGKYWRHKNKYISRFSSSLRYKISNIERKLKINRLKKCDIEFRKGANWFSITENTAKYIVSRSDLLKYFKYSYCADELFVQTIVYNSKYRNNLYKDNKNFMRYIDWKKGNPAILKMEDYDSMMKSNMIFARKFSSTVDKEVIDKIYNKLKE